MLCQNLDFLPHFWFMIIGTYVASKSGLLCLTFDSWLQGHILCQNLDFFASLLIHNYRDIYCVKFWTFFVSLLIHDYRDIPILCQILDFFASLLIHNYKDIYCVKFWTFLPDFWFITIGTYVLSNSVYWTKQNQTCKNRIKT